MLHPHDFAGMTIRAFCESLAAKAPAPGGGAVAGVTSAHAAALLAMVIEYSRGKASFARFESEADALLGALRVTVEASLAAAKADADAYSALNALWKKPKDDPERQAGWADAVHRAIAAPHLIIALAAETAGRCRAVAGASAKHLDSDLAIAADLARAAARAAAWNVRVNLPSVSDAAEQERLAKALADRLAAIDADAHAVDAAIAART